MYNWYVHYNTVGLVAELRYNGSVIKIFKDYYPDNHKEVFTITVNGEMWLSNCGSLEEAKSTIEKSLGESNG
jgi:hypothetical protein